MVPQEQNTIDGRTPDDLETKVPGAKILKETKSLHNFKLGLRKFLAKYKQGAMTLADYQNPADPLAVRAFKDGQNSFIELLDPFIKE